LLQFLYLLKSVNVQGSDILVSFDIVSLFTNILVEEVLKIIKDKLQEGNTLAECSDLEVDAVLELQEVCLKTTYFQVDHRFFQQRRVWLWGILCLHW
jgi:hypothetical protein